MNRTLIASLLLFAIACNVPQTKKKTDNRPASQLSLMRKLGALDGRMAELSTNAVLADNVADSLTKFALDSLKEVKEWELIVQEITEDSYGMSKLGELLYAGRPVYNLKMISLFDTTLPKADTLAIGTYVFMTYTIPKYVEGDDLKKQLAAIKSLSPGDTVLVSGSITMLNDQYKADFSPMVKTDHTFGKSLDVLLTDIKKKNL